MADHNYRLYILDFAGHIDSRIDLGAFEDDAGALAHAGTLAEGRGHELWDRARLVGRRPLAQDTARSA